MTDPASMEIATMVLRGKVNAGLVAALGRHGVPSVGLSGVDGGMITARPHPDPDLGLVGEAGEVDPSLLHVLMQRGLVPVSGTDCRGLQRERCETSMPIVSAAPWPERCRPTLPCS